MSIVIFIIILGVLIFVHELGHFIVAKKSGIRVDEFAIGFPPRLFSWQKGETKYSLNLIPIGGYVKIFGETVDENALDPKNTDSFINKSRWTQASVLVAGVLFNILFAWFLFSTALFFGFPTVVSNENIEQIKESFVVITNVAKDSPAFEAGLQSGDQIVSLVRNDNEINFEKISISTIQDFISVNTNELQMQIIREGREMEVAISPKVGIFGDKPAIGISMEKIGILQLPFFVAIGRGFVMTGQIIREIFIGVWTLLSETFSGQGSFDNVAGPVGLVGLVGSASNFGLTYLLGFTAFISINLAILNILPFPALDGGRLLLVLIEGVTRRQIKPSIVNAINAFGFIALIILMIVITVNDVFKLF